MKVHSARTLGGLLLGMMWCVVAVQGLPVSAPKKSDSEPGHSDKKKPDAGESDGETALEYDRYLREVVQTLESDPEFRKKLDEAPEADIRVS